MGRARNPGRRKEAPAGKAVDSGAEAVPRGWPSWACWTVSAVLLFHITALVVFESTGLPWYSELEEDLSRGFWWYIGLINQDYTHRYFAPAPDSSVPVLEAELTFEDGRPPLTIRLPDHSVRPRIRYVRQLALIWHLSNEMRLDESQPRPFWARSFARHLCRTHPGCARVKLSLRRHDMPALVEAYAAAAQGERIDLEQERYYGWSELLGVYSCRDL